MAFYILFSKISNEFIITYIELFITYLILISFKVLHEMSDALLAILTLVLVMFCKYNLQLIIIHDNIMLIARFRNS